MPDEPERKPKDEPAGAERRPGVPPRQPAADHGRDAVEESEEESFPSSDPPATSGPGV